MVWNAEGVCAAPRTRTVALAGMLGLLFAVNACGNNSAGGKSPSGGAGSAGMGSGGGSGGSGGPPTIDPNRPDVPAEAVNAKTVDAPSGFTFSKADAFADPVKMIANRSSVRLYLPAVAGVRDYRVFALVDGVSIELKDDTENVVGGTITCAGLRQRNECDNAQAVNDYGPGPFHVSACSEDARAVDTPPTVVQMIEVNGLKDETVLAVEAIDTLCPFQGSIGNVHQDVPIFAADKPIQATYKGKLGNFPPSQLTFALRTEAEMRQEYGSLILNGHGHAPADPDPMKGPFYNLSQPAPPVSPKVLNRVVVSVKPTGTAKVPEGYKDTDIFEDFEDTADQFTFVEQRKDVEATILPAGYGPIASVRRYENSKWNWYSFNGENNGDAAQVWIDKGELHMTMADIAQDVMGSNIIYPKRPIALSDDDATFTHITFEIQTDATQRRYWYLHLCGAAEKGKTYSGTALPNDAGIVAAPFFMDPTTGHNISMAGWNCLQFVPRSGDFDVIPGGDIHNARLGGDGRPETDIRMLVNRPTPAGQDPVKDQDSIILLDPSMNPGNTQAMGGQWTRTWNDQHQINGMMLDDTMFITQRTHLDFYINRTRVVMYANGAQKACDNIAAHKLSMAEAAVGIGQVFYHSSGERSELIEPQWIRTGQNYYLHNTPFTDVRSIDNLGIQEGVKLPATFNAAPCFTTPGK